MRTIEPEAGFLPVIEADCGPPAHSVAGATIRPHAALMRVVCLVTVIAAGALQIALIAGLVAGPAIQACVPAGQRETTDVEMVKIDARPGRAVVAGLTLLAITALVHVIVTVTTDAVNRLEPESLLRVAGPALHGCMLPGQRETRFSMIEADVQPGARVMAITTHNTKPTAMNVVFMMAGEARRLGHSKRLAIHVTGIAVSRTVDAKQWKIRESVVETFEIEIDRNKIAAFMLAMAVIALRLPRRRYQPVIALSRADVGTNIFMTSDAQFSLRLVRQRCMALLAIALNIGMRFDNRARHDQ